MDCWKSKNQKIEYIVITGHWIDESCVEYVRRFDAKLKIFSEIVKQLKLPDKKLVDDCRTRWYSTYEMLAAVIKFKDVFPRFVDREPHYHICPSAEDWTKAEKVCSVLELFWTATHIISGSDYPTSNLFLNEVSRVKVLLDKKTLENDIFIRDLVARMKAKFDKYWGETNLLISIAAVMEPRCKLRALNSAFQDYILQRLLKGRLLLFERHYMTSILSMWLFSTLKAS
ncbi:UNVERIFIED_CONTAM: hypothetical protein Sradi_1524700 [Sesamum radiatum]|uniref:hAT-like transposase RNase-H fold domain-containing protein n=1 Tax=Sesamum radiatum TaxID=300843 RepID=A0AAW2U7L9_SESRA